MRSRIDQFWLSRKVLRQVRRKDPYMAQETTGAGTAKSKDPGMTGSDLTGMTGEERDQVASKLVDRFSLWSGPAGLIPIPLVDIAPVDGIQLQILCLFSHSYP